MTIKRGLLALCVRGCVCLCPRWPLPKRAAFQARETLKLWSHDSRLLVTIPFAYMCVCVCVCVSKASQMLCGSQHCAATQSEG